jgi:predicted nucleic acid-binding protein
MISHSIAMKYMNDDATIDSNILIYAFGKQDNSKSRIAREIITACNKISLQTINETVFVLKRKFNFSIKELQEIIQFFKEKYIVKNIDIHTLETAIIIMDKYQYSFWDSMMLASALENKCTEIYSEDMQHNQTIEGRLRIINPFL